MIKMIEELQECEKKKVEVNAHWSLAVIGFTCTKGTSARKSASDRPSWSGLATEASITSSTIFSSRAYVIY